MRECTIILVLVLYLLLRQSRKYVPCHHLDLILGELLVPENPICLMKLPDLLAWRVK